MRKFKVFIDQFPLYRCQLCMPVILLQGFPLARFCPDTTRQGLGFDILFLPSWLNGVRRSLRQHARKPLWIELSDDRELRGGLFWFEGDGGAVPAADCDNAATRHLC